MTALREFFAADPVIMALITGMETEREAMRVPSRSSKGSQQRSTPSPRQGKRPNRRSKRSSPTIDSTWIASSGSLVRPSAKQDGCDGSATPRKPGNTCACPRCKSPARCAIPLRLWTPGRHPAERRLIFQIPLDGDSTRPSALRSAIRLRSLLSVPSVRFP